MANTYSPEQLGIKAPSGGFQQGGWYSGRQYWGGTLSDPGVIHPSSNQVGAGQVVSPEVNAQSAALQGISPQQLESYLQQQRQIQPKTATPTQVTPAPATVTPTPTGSSGTTATNAGLGVVNAPVPVNLVELSNSLQKSLGIDKLQQDYLAKERAYNEVKAKNNDNPFLSEATRVGRERKLQEQFNADTATLQKEIQMKKADMETQLALATKQLDINNEATKIAFDQISTLISMGAYDNASGEDIANATRATGMSSGMILAAINANKDKNVKTEIKEWDDGTNQGYAVINSKTGQLIATQTLAASKPKATDSKVADQQQNEANLIQDVKAGVVPSDFINHYSGVIDLETMYRLYNMYSPWGHALETLDQWKQGSFANLPGWQG